MSVDGKRWKTLGVPEKQDRTGLDCWEIRFSWKADRNDCFKISIRKLPLSIMKPKGQQSLYAENRGFFCFHLVLEKGWFGQPKYCTFFQLYCSLWTSRSFPLLFLDVFIWSLSHKRGGREKQVRSSSPSLRAGSLVIRAKRGARVSSRARNTRIGKTQAREPARRQG